MTPVSGSRMRGVVMALLLASCSSPVAVPEPGLLEGSWVGGYADPIVDAPPIRPEPLLALALDHRGADLSGRFTERSGEWPVSGTFNGELAFLDGEFESGTFEMYLKFQNGELTGSVTERRDGALSAAYFVRFWRP